MDTTSVTLIVNGQVEDYDRHLKRVVAEALSELLPAALAERAPADTGGGTLRINPDMAYRTNDPRVIELFGCANVKGNPSQAVINRLRAAGIEPMTRGRGGSTVFGHQIQQYMDAIKRQTHPFLHRS